MGRRTHKTNEKKIKLDSFTEYAIGMSIAFILGWSGLFAYLYWFFN